MCRLVIDSMRNQLFQRWRHQVVNKGLNVGFVPPNSQRSKRHMTRLIPIGTCRTIILSTVVFYSHTFFSTRDPSMRLPFSQSDIKHMVEWLVENAADGTTRSGNKLWQGLMNDPVCKPEIGSYSCWLGEFTDNCPCSLHLRGPQDTPGSPGGLYPARLLV
jgi:hypothetical protein